MRLGLAFDRERERAFVRAYVLGEFRRVQFAMVLGICVYYAFSAWDRIIDPAGGATTHLIRLAVVVLVLVPATLLTFVERWRAAAEWLLLAYGVIPATVLSVIYTRLDGGFDHGAAGIVIVILFVSTLLPMRVAFFVVFAGATWIVFDVSEALGGRALPGMPFVNDFYVGTALLLATYAVATREMRARVQFSTAASLQAAKDRTDAAMTELRAARANLAQAERMAALGHLVKGLAHEVNTPLGLAVTTATTLEIEAGRLSSALEAKTLRQSDLAAGLGRLRSGASLVAGNLGRASGLVESLRQVDVDRIDEQPRPFGLRGCLQELGATLTFTLREKGHRLEIECPDNLGLHGFPRTLSEILREMILNAVLHGYPDRRGGTIRLTVASGAPDRVRIAVEDDGRGIAPADLGRLFDPFYTTARGTGRAGLGLHVAFNLVTALLCGEIEGHDRPEGGARFVIDLPATVETGFRPGGRERSGSEESAPAPRGIDRAGAEFRTS